MSEGTNYKPVIKKLSKKQREVLDQICINNDRGHSSIILKSLIRKGLIQMYVQKLDVMCGVFACELTMPYTWHGVRFARKKTQRRIFKMANLTDKEQKFIGHLVVAIKNIDYGYY